MQFLLPRYKLVESWTQTLDFSKKRKGAQCDDIELADAESHATAKRFLEAEEEAPGTTKNMDC